ncbi:MAG: phosphoribosylglycinamide formyltransferase [Bacteroidota bacterium]
MKNIAILASGKGSNANNICNYFHNHPLVKVTAIISDRKEAGVFQVAKKHQIESLYINKAEWLQPHQLIAFLKEKNIDLIVLAGFLKLIPTELIIAFPGKIINIHPALLPKYGGKGMYGHFVHEAVHAAGEKETGITIHYVDEHYDEGDIIFQATTTLNNGDDADIIAARIHQLEMKHFPAVIERILLPS